jgi:hypothetical protein
MDETIKQEVESPSEILFKAEEDEVSLDQFESGDIDKQLMNQSDDAIKYKPENGDTPQKVYYESENILYDVCDFYPKKAKGIDKTPYYDKTYTNCDMCEFKTKFPSNLKKHKITVHEKVKKLCQFCNKGFIYLKEHIDTMHSKSKLYVCKHCNFSSVRLSGLRSHMKRKHSEPRVKQTCPICFIKCFNIQIHVKRIHEDPVQQREDFHCTSCSYKGTKI